MLFTLSQFVLEGYKYCCESNDVYDKNDIEMTKFLLIEIKIMQYLNMFLYYVPIESDVPLFPGIFKRVHT